MRYYHNSTSGKLIVSLVVGDYYTEVWNRMMKDQWLEYCQKYSYSLLIFSEPLDRSERAQARSLSWQKCLVLAHDELKNYEQVIWLDADILISPFAPDITKGIKSESLAATDAYKFFSKDLHDHIYALYLEECFRFGNAVIPNPTPERYYTNMGLPPTSRVWQAGVMLVNPRLHSDLFKSVYYSYEEKRAGIYTYNYEMRPLSLHMDELHPIELDPRFNVIFSNIFLFQNPEVFYNWWRSRTLSKEQRIHQLKSALFHSWFLHLAGGTTFLDFLNDLSCTDLVWKI